MAVFRINEIRELAKRLLARADSALFTDVPQLRNDLRSAAHLLKKMTGAYAPSDTFDIED